MKGRANAETAIVTDKDVVYNKTAAQTSCENKQVYRAAEFPQAVRLNQEAGQHTLSGNRKDFVLAGIESRLALYRTKCYTCYNELGEAEVNDDYRED